MGREYAQKYKKAYMDECPIPYGKGQHAETGRAEQGTQVRVSKDYWMSYWMCNATWAGAIDEVEVLKSICTKAAAHGSDSFNH